ncbi:DUF3375 family protein [Bifidobacterium choloepi]|uniref:DUF3375 domain-containing protein n=1 Tax=Bifidobacterium choloepi TaxID=2614131 RepID=A0A6I5MY08_9BIFI|nr:DUF3375 family protein [Bifidobacterium choloepi]NEG69147.1 DUF3375 domain-containing protein [Bifidobacterium choloepi]
MGDIRDEMEQLRSVYDTGVLRLLTRPKARIYVALLRSAFDPLTSELPKEDLEERFSRGVATLANMDEVALRDDEDAQDYARHTIAELMKEGNGDYAWLANSLDPASHRFLYRLTARAHRAIEALDKLQDDTQTMSGAQANSIIMEIEHARMELTADLPERIRLLEQEIADRQEQIRTIEEGNGGRSLSDKEVEDIINVVHGTLRGVPIDLRELMLTERDNGDALRRRMQAGAMSVEEILKTYHDEYRKSFAESDAGRRFEDAFQVIVTDEGRDQIDTAMRAIARTPYVEGGSAVLLEQVKEELAHIYDGIEGVRRQMRVSDEAVSRLVRQQTDTRFHTMLVKLNKLSEKINADARDHPTSTDRPYETGISSPERLATLPTRPSRSMARAAVPSLSELGNYGADVPEVNLRELIENGGPRLIHMAALVRENPVMNGGLVDIAASFNELPPEERRESEFVGFLGALRGPGEGTPTVVWNCIDQNGEERQWLTTEVLAGMSELEDIIEER